MIRWLLIVLALAPLQLIAADTPPAVVGPVQKLVDALDAIRKQRGVAAFGLVMVDNRGVIHLETRGLADRKRKLAIGDDAIFRIGSISKMFTGLAAARLEADGKLDLSAPIVRWNMTGTYTNPWQKTDPVSVARLLEHSAGLTDISPPEWDFSDPRQLPLSTTLRMYPEARRLQWRPGWHHSYSNAGAGLAAYVMEQATGSSYEELLAELVFGPLAMDDTSVFPPAGRLPTGYDTDGQTPIPYWHQIFRPFAAINSTLADMGRFLRMLLNQGRLDDRQHFAAATIARLERPTTTLGARSGLEAGYGLGIYSWERNGVLFFGHGGDADGYLSRLGYSRSNGTGYYLVITAFQKRTLWRMQELIEAFLVRGVEAGREPDPAPLEAAELAALPGAYERVTHRFTRIGAAMPLQIINRNGSLYTRMGGGEQRALIKVNSGLFRRSGQHRATVFLGRAVDAAIYFQEDGDNFVRR